MEIAERLNSHSSIQGCIVCGQRACSYELVLDQNTGALFVRYPKKYKGNMCRQCAKRIFRKVQVHNLFFGWWGTISFFATLVYLPANTYNYLKFLSATKKAGL